MKKQQGFLEISTAVILVTVLFIAYYGMEWMWLKKEQADSDVTASTMNLILTGSKAYYQDNGTWPSGMSQILGRYIPDAPSAKNSPYGTPYLLSVTAGNLIDIRVDAKARRAASRVASKVPLSALSGNVVYAQHGKPGTEPALSAFIKKDGTTPLEGEWDVGGQGISNVKDITITGMNNRTVLSGLSYNNVQQNNQYVNLVNCPTGRANRKITVIPLTYSKNGYPFRQMGAVEGRYGPAPGLWSDDRAYVRVWEQEQDGSQYWFVPNPASATVLVLQQCTK